MVHNNYGSEHAFEGFGPVFASAILMFLFSFYHLIGRWTHFGSTIGMRRRTATPTTATGPVVDDRYDDHSRDAFDASQSLFLWLLGAATVNWIFNGLVHSVMAIMWVMFVLGLLWVFSRIFLRGFSEIFAIAILLLLVIQFCLAFVNRYHVGWWNTWNTVRG